MIDGIPTLKDIGALKGKTVLLRADINCTINPQTGKISDDTRIKRSVRTVRELLENEAKVVVIAHQGDPGAEFTTLKKHAEILSRLLGTKVGYVEDLFGPAALEAIKALRPQEILLLENLRIFSEETLLYEKKFRDKPWGFFTTSLLVRKLAPLVEAYVDDAFATSHRIHPSTIGFPEVLPSAAGRLMEEEIRALSRVRCPKKPCVFCLGGLKIEDAFKIMRRIIKDQIVDEILTFGVVGQVMLMGLGHNLGKSTETFIEEQQLGGYIPVARELMRDYSDVIKVPVDVAVEMQGRKEVCVETLPAEAPIFDIGRKTTERFCKIIEDAKTTFMNGPAGVYERLEFEFGTRKILETMAENLGFTVVGGGHTIAAMRKFGLEGKFSFVSTGGGALIRYVSGEKLPSIEVLKKDSLRNIK